jgi:hypothetical protein
MVHFGVGVAMVANLVIIAFLILLVLLMMGKHQEMLPVKLEVVVLIVF